MSSHALQYSATKIICTIGPATSSRASISQLADAGMTVARINFSHGSAEEHLQAIENIKQVRSARGEYIAIAMDTKGPELRVFMRGDIAVETGHRLELSSRRSYLQATAEKTEHSAPVPGEDGGSAAKPIGTNISDFSIFEIGDILLLDDGKLRLRAVHVGENALLAVAENDHVLRPGKKISTRREIRRRGYLSEEDIQDIGFGLANGVDLIFLSFTEAAGDVGMARSLCEDQSVQLIAKIETRRGIENVDEIVRASDGIMIARGDLATDVGLSALFSAQMRLQEAASGRVVIMATEMMMSMVESATPTRAEVSDVGNAVLHGSHAVLLSSETAIGKHAVSCVEMVRRVCVDAEGYLRSINRPCLPDLSGCTESSGSPCAVERRVVDGTECIFSGDVRAVRPLTFVRGIRIFITNNNRGQQ